MNDIYTYMFVVFIVGTILGIVGLIGTRHNRIAKWLQLQIVQQPECEIF